MVYCVIVYSCTAATTIRNSSHTLRKFLDEFVTSAAEHNAIMRLQGGSHLIMRQKV